MREIGPAAAGSDAEVAGSYPLGVLWLYEERGVRRLKRAIVVLLLVAALAFLARGADRPTDPSLRTVPDAPVAPAPTGGGSELPGDP